MMLKILSNYAKYSGIWISIALNPFHWRLAFEFMHPDELNPNMRGIFISLLPISLRVVVDDGSWQENNMNNKESLAFIIGMVLVIITVTVCVTYYNLNKTAAMKSNIDSAIVKGIDPLAVRCAYEYGDNVCIAYAISHGKMESQATVKK